MKYYENNTVDIKLFSELLLKVVLSVKIVKLLLFIKFNKESFFKEGLVYGFSELKKYAETSSSK